MKTEFTSTIESTVISAEMFNKVNKKSFPFVFKLNGIMTADEAEEAVEKLVKGGKAVLEMNKLDKDGKAVLDKDGKAVKESVKISDCRLAYVDGVTYSCALYKLPIEHFIKSSKKLPERGADGKRTREAKISRTMESTKVQAVMRNKTSKASFNYTFTFAENLTDDEAEKAVEKLVKAGKAVLEINKLDKDGKAVLDKDGKAVKESVKISDCRLAYVDGLEVESAYYEMGVNSFIQLCNRFGTVKEMTADEYKAYIKAREEAKAAREAEKAAREAEKDSNKGSASN